MVGSSEVRLHVQVQPNAGQNKVLGLNDGVLQVKIAAPPLKGKANQELIKFLSGVLGVSKSCLSIEKGLTSRQKTVLIGGLTSEQVVRQLEEWGSR